MRSESNSFVIDILDSVHHQPQRRFRGIPATGLPSCSMGKYDQQSPGPRHPGYAVFIASVLPGDRELNTTISLLPRLLQSASGEKRPT